VTADEPGPVTSLVREFPGWDIRLAPAGVAMCSAYFRSDDGRHRHVIVAATPAELLKALRAGAAAS
jgi:hypothetical protein